MMDMTVVTITIVIKASPRMDENGGGVEQLRELNLIVFIVVWIS